MASKYKMQLKWKALPNGTYRVADKEGKFVATVQKPSDRTGGWWLSPFIEEFQAKVEMDLPFDQFEDIAGTFGFCTKKYFRTKREIEEFVIEGYSVDQVAKWKRVRAALANGV